MNIAIIGTGYVGLVTGACFALKGHDVTCVDLIQEKVDKINKGIPPIYEQGLDSILKEVVSQNKLKATLDTKSAVKEAEVIFICVETPSLPDGSMDYTYVETAARDVAKALEKDQDYKVVVIKSTCIPGTTNRIGKEILEVESSLKVGEDFGLGMNPEFLREGIAVNDFLYPDRIVIGGSDRKTQDFISKCYKEFTAPLLFVDNNAAEMIKYASNSFLAMKISFINEMANLSEKFGVDVKDISRGVGLDQRISDKFLRAGAGFGGSCLLADSFVIIKDSFKGIYPIKIADLYDKIKERQENVEALSYDISKEKLIFNKIVNASKRNFEGNLVEIETSMNTILSTTEDHPFIVFKDNDYKVVLAKNIEKGNELPVFLNPDVDKIEKVYDKIDLIDTLDKKKFDFEKVRVKPKKKHFDLIKDTIDYCFEKSRATAIIKSNCMNLAEFLSIEDKITNIFSRSDLSLFTLKGKTTYFPAILKLDKNFCKILGYYISEGWITFETLEEGQRGLISFELNYSENEYLTEIKSIFEKWDLKYKSYNKPENKTTQIIVSSSIFAFLLLDVLKVGRNSYTKNVPDIIFSLDHSLKSDFLRCVFRGGGQVHFPTNTNSVIYEYNSINEDLIHKLILLFHSIGIVPSYNKSGSEESTDYVHYIRISTKKQIERLKHFKDEKTQEKIESTLKNYKTNAPTGFKIHNENISLTRVNSISTLQVKNRNVYSIEVENTENFVTDFGLIVHNCFPKDVSALYHRSKEVNMPSKMLEATLAVNSSQPLRLIELLKEELDSADLGNKIIALLGLSFKPNTDDMREAPSLIVLKKLLEEGAIVKATDPVALENAKKELKHSNLTYLSDIETTLEDADACILITEWDKFTKLTPKVFLEKMKEPILIDGRRAYDYQLFRKEGVKYRAIGLGK